ncbi:MAG: chorismate lyase [Pseudomonadota bacterium]
MMRAGSRLRPPVAPHTVSRRVAWSCRLAHDLSLTAVQSAAALSTLRSRASLTAQIQARGQFSLKLLQQGLARPTRDEAAVLGVRTGCCVWVREVALLCDQAIVAFAHTALPRQPRGPLSRWFAALGQRSLGTLLFAHPSFVRGDMTFKHVRSRHPLFASAHPVLAALNAEDEKTKAIVSATAYWARRSYFTYQGRSSACASQQSVLVTEVFAPAYLCTSTL